MATIAAGDLPNLPGLTDDDKFMVVDAPGTTKAPKLLTATIARAYMQTGAVLTGQVGVPGGLATLGSDGKLTAGQVPTLAAAGVSSFNTRTGAVTLTTADILPLLQALNVAFIVSTDGHTAADHFYVGVNDPTSVAGGSISVIDGDVFINPS
jgi:hypothetical protein